MTGSGLVHREFHRRASQIPVHGLGLSIDLHAPDLTSLRRTLQERQVVPTYLEVFRTTTSALASARRDIADGLLTYHGEGLWLTQPEMVGGWASRPELDETVEQLQTLQSAWLNHECATKYLAGYAFGTYLPPLYTPQSAQVVAENTQQIQGLLDERCQLTNGTTPLVLLEMPPLTYFLPGTIPVQTFFRLLTEQVACGMVLDIGHLWTLFRYSGTARTQSLEQLVETFLNEFPLDRVVEIHVAGLAVHESGHAEMSPASIRMSENSLPAWTDAHAAPIPSILFEMLDQVLSHPRLTNLKGIALEVDTKPEALIAEEFAVFSERYADCFQRVTAGVSRAFGGPEDVPVQAQSMSVATKQILEQEYERYARVLIGQAELPDVEWGRSTGWFEELDRYRSSYLPYEILQWGGKIDDMFPDTCRPLMERGLSLAGFLSFWFREPRPLHGIYDYFLLKIERFVEFIREVAPDLQPTVEREAVALQQAYQVANEPQISMAVN